MADVPAWNAKGEWFDVCRCNVPCPCSWAQPPDDDYCDGVLVWHIREGRYGDVALDGLNVVAFASFKGNLWEHRARADLAVKAPVAGPPRTSGSRRQSIHAMPAVRWTSHLGDALEALRG